MSDLDQLTKQVRRLVDREIGLARDELRGQAGGSPPRELLLAGALLGAAAVAFAAALAARLRRPG